MNINVNGKIPKHFYSKDLALLIIGQIGTAGGTGYAIEYSGQVNHRFIHGSKNDIMQYDY